MLELPIKTKRPPSFFDTMAVYAGYLDAGRFAGGTRVEYLRDVVQLLHFLDEVCHLPTPMAVMTAHLDRYLAQLHDHGFNSTTRRRTVAAIRSFLAVLHEAGTIDVDPGRTLLPPPRELATLHVLGDEECDHLRRVSAVYPRDAALIAVLLDAGLTVSETARLWTDDIAVAAPLDLTSPGALRVGVRRRTGARYRSAGTPVTPSRCTWHAAHLCRRTASFSRCGTSR